jgi:hypothetical protein
MAENKLARELETRNLAERPKQWLPPELLPEPKKQPGYAYRWIRVSTLNQADPMNLSAKRREGWEPCKMEDHPELMLHVDTSRNSTGYVEVGGLMLCKTPQEFVDQRNAYYQKQASDQATAVDNSLMRESDPRMPIFNERKSSVSFGKGSK